jgi:hypothetical protein
MLVQPAIKSVKAQIAYFNMVIGKWERGGSAKEILRSAGVGEARVALRLRELMMQNQNLTVAKDMAVHASKMLEMLNPLAGHRRILDTRHPVREARKAG